MARKLGSDDDSKVVPINPNAEVRREQASNLTSGTFLEAVREIAKINGEVRALNERRKSVRKKWKSEGIELGILDATIKMAEWDRAEVRAHFDNARRYAEWLGLPIGVQADLFAKLGEDQVQKKEWFALGAVASRLGRSPRDIPEECPPEYKQHWLAGFNGEDEKAWTEAEVADAQTQAAAGIDPNKPGNIADVAAALDAKPKRGRKGAAAQPDDDSDRDPDDQLPPQAAGAPEGEGGEDDAAFDAPSGPVVH